jgi:hypothetical protein
MIPDRLPWRLRARPSATLHEIQVRPTNERQSELVLVIIQTERSAVKSEYAAERVRIERLKIGLQERGAPCLAAFARRGNATRWLAHPGIRTPCELMRLNIFEQDYIPGHLPACEKQMLVIVRPAKVENLSGIELC